MDKFLDLAQQAFESASAFVDANYRADWDYSIKAFRGEHASGSKYLAPGYASRSRLFRPKTRSVIRKNEAAGAVALFSNMDVVNITPGNPDDQMSVAAAAADKELLEYRLSRTIPAFPLVMGALQDAQTQGMVCSYQYWEYEMKGERRIKDQPCIELRPIENIRIDGGASWIDPVGTSPYFCDIIPMYVCQVKGMMENKDSKTGAPKWKKFEDSAILKARPDSIDTTRLARLGKQQDPYEETTGIKDFDIVWVMRWFMKDSSNDDFTFYTLGTEELLTKAQPIEEVYFHGHRPYVMGYSILETHRVMKTSMPVLVRGLQQEANEIANQRIDNVKFVLNKRWMVARGRQVDVNSLVRNVPGGVTLVTDPKTDIQESNWPDVTSSSYVEQDRLNADFDDVAGNFSPNTKFANKGTNDTLGGTRMAAQGAGLMTDYLLRTFIETWWEPVLRQLLLLERYYETDEVVLSVCANKAQLFRRFGVSRITDDLLMKEVNVQVNVGMGSSNPTERFQKNVILFNTVNQLVATAPPGANVQEQIKELCSNAGYRDGARFYSQQQDPRLMKAMQLVQQLTQQLQGKGMELQAQGQIEQQKLLSGERVKDKELQVDYFRIQGDLRIREAELVIAQQELMLEEMKLRSEMAGNQEEHQFKIAEFAAKIEEAKLKLENERQKIAALAVKTAAEIEKAHVELEASKVEAANVARTAGEVSKVNRNMDGIGKELQSAKESIANLEGLKDGVTQLGQGMGLMLHAMSKTEAKKKTKKISLQKDGGKTKGARIEFDDGSAEEIAVE